MNQLLRHTLGVQAMKRAAGVVASPTKTMARIGAGR